MGKTTNKRQKGLLSVIYEHIKSIGYPPTFAEMKEGLGLSSNQSVIDTLRRLEDNRFIKRTEGIARSIAILPLGYKALGKPPLAAFLGVTSAGAPIEVIEISGEWQSLPSSTDKLEKLNSEIFLLKVHGDSMINAGIENEDVVLVKTQKEFVSGDVVLAQVGNESTVKRFISDDKPPYIYLKPENPDHKVIPATDDMQLTGKVISVLKNGYWKPVK